MHIIFSTGNSHRLNTCNIVMYYCIVLNYHVRLNNTNTTRHVVPEMNSNPMHATSTEQDTRARKTALDITNSYIIQAPAGSGKTELLIQRYLKLLTSVQHPKLICAVTFTKKACGELRTRIQQALQLTKIPCTDLSEHKRLTLALAQEVNIHAKQLNWCIDNIALECNITTIDGMVNQWLSLAPTPYNAWINYDLIQQKQFYYDVIADFIQQFCINDHNDLHQDYQEILRYNHCDQDYIIRLLYSALSTREQWIREVIVSRMNTKLATSLASNIAQLHTTHIEQIPHQLHQLVSACIHNLHCMNRIYSCADDAYHELFELDHDSNTWNINQWQLFTTYLHTSSGTIRKQYQSKQGFLAQAQLKKLEQSIQESLHTYAQQTKEILSDITQPDFCTLLTQLHTLPTIENDEWCQLKPLLNILPPLVAFLHVSMQKQQKTDYSAKTMQLSLALQDDNHHALTEALYQQNEHLLIDEFQDTSHQQLALFEALVNLWQGDTQRTITIVGDPMQSIYGFRQAEVRLFEQVATQGLAQVKLQPLYLRRNYRSCDNIVNWCNNLFEKINHNNYFLAAQASHSDPLASVSWTANTDTATEAQRISEQIKRHQQQHPNDSIAILVRSRTQLTHIIPQLQQDNINYSAQDIDNLSQEQALLDCLTLYMLAQNLYDRQHWIALLRSPFVGLSWCDIYTLAQPKDSCIWDNICRQDIPLSKDAQQQLERVKPILHAHLAMYQRKPHAQLTFKLWHALGGKWVIRSNAVYHYIEEFFTTLTGIDENNKNLSHYASGLELLQNIHRKPTINNKHNIQIMTIHKAKGLEFDYVILPGLERMPPLLNKNLINSMEINIDNKRLTLLHTQPKHQSHASKLQHFIHTFKQKSTDKEQQRLCYVACTRAKKQLRLHYCNNKPPHPRSWLTFMQPPDAQIITSTPKELDTDSVIKTHLTRLPLEHTLPKHLEIDLAHSTKSLTDITTAQQWGDVVHQYMNWLHTSHLEPQVETVTEKIKLYCQQYRLDTNKHNNTFTWLCNRLHRMHQDEIFKWLYAKHPYRKHEQLIIYNQETLRVDRYFIDKNNILWIIDFKTYGTDQNSNHVELTKQQLDNYHKQLEKYQHALQEIHPTTKIKSALYFPLQQHMSNINITSTSTA